VFIQQEFVHRIKPQKREGKNRTIEEKRRRNRTRTDIKPLCSQNKTTKERAKIEQLKRKEETELEQISILLTVIDIAVNNVKKFQSLQLLQTTHADLFATQCYA
jgi:hypothetical protein